MKRFIDRFIQAVRDNPKTKRIPIGPNPEDPTYWRYFVIPRNRFFNIYLHNFRHDDAEDLHDHRMANISILLQGQYYEERFAAMPIPGFPLPRTKRELVRKIKFRLPATPHRVVLRRDVHNRPIAIWSLFIGFPQIRDWGFWMEEDGRAFWLSHTQVVMTLDPTDPGYGQRKAM